MDVARVCDVYGCGVRVCVWCVGCVYVCVVCMVVACVCVCVVCVLERRVPTEGDQCVLSGVNSVECTAGEVGGQISVRGVKIRERESRD